MKRLLGFLGAFAVLAVVVAATAGATPSSPGITLTATPAVFTVGSTLTLSGVYTPAGDASAQGEWIYLAQYDNATCTTWTTDVYDSEVQTAAGGAYTASIADLPVGTYYYRAEMEGVDAMSACVPVTVAAETVVPTVPSDTVASSYLCWNHEMTNPVAYVDRVADQMWTTGNYFEPQAILGNVVGGTNIGAYHLVCNAPATMTNTGLGLGGSGDVYSAELMTAYHQAHAGGNDLNLYHIWK